MKKQTKRTLLVGSALIIIVLSFLFIGNRQLSVFDQATNVAAGCQYTAGSSYSGDYTYTQSRDGVYHVSAFSFASNKYSIDCVYSTKYSGAINNIQAIGWSTTGTTTMSYTYGVVYIYLWNYATSAWEYTGQIFYENEISTREGWISTDYISSSGEMKIRFALYATVPSSFGTLVIKIDSVGWAVIPKQSPDLPPIPIIDSPSDVAYIEGMGGQSITWSPSSDSPRDYTILKDGIEVQTSPWSGAAITYSIDGLTAGNYVFTCKVEDSFFQTTEDSVNVKVQAATNITLPAINNPADITYIAGVAGHSVTWLTSGSNPLTYKIYKDGVVVKSDTWIPGGITYSVDGLAEGTYVFKCEIIASGGALAYDEVVVTVQPPQENPVNENVLPILGVAALIGLGMIYFIRRK